MHQLTRNGVFVTSHDAAGRSVHLGEPVHPMPHQDPVHSRLGQADMRSDTGRTPLVLTTQPHDPTLEPLVSAVRPAAGDRRPVIRTRLALREPS